MTHFLVLVVGDNVESQLAPYHEYECTGQLDKYVQRVSVLDELRAAYAAHECKMSFEEYVCEDHPDAMVQGGDEPADNWYHVVDDTGKIVDVIHRTNPNAKWDYWQVGGRYAEAYLGKDGNTICEGIKSDFDFDAERERIAKHYADKYDKVQQIINGKTWEPWEAVLKRFDVTDFSSDTLTEARSFYNNQESVRAIRKDSDLCWERDIDDFLVSREDYIARHRNNAIAPYAFVKDSEWHAQGDMGWWACDRKTCTEDEWNEQFNQMLESLPDDTRLTVVDCHI